MSPETCTPPRNLTDDGEDLPVCDLPLVVLWHINFDVKPLGWTSTSSEPEAWYRSRSGGLSVTRWISCFHMSSSTNVEPRSTFWLNVKTVNRCNCVTLILSRWNINHMKMGPEAAFVKHLQKCVDKSQMWLKHVTACFHLKAKPGTAN